MGKGVALGVANVAEEATPSSPLKEGRRRGRMEGGGVVVCASLRLHTHARTYLQQRETVVFHEVQQPPSEERKH